MENIFWKAYSNEERHAAIQKIQTIISTYGHIVDFNVFSDVSISIKIEIQELHIDALSQELKLNLGMDNADPLHSHSTTERVVFLNISF
jgi:hypothetical protein